MPSKRDGAGQVHHATGLCRRRRWDRFGGFAVARAREIEDDPGNFVVQLLLDGALVFHSGAQGEIAGIDGGRSSFVESRALRG
jgi:hypothetical protein